MLQYDEENSNQFPLRIAEKFFFDPLKLDWVRARKGLASGLEAAWTECWAWQDDTSMEESVHKKLFDAVMGTLTPHWFRLCACDDELTSPFDNQGAPSTTGSRSWAT